MIRLYKPTPKVTGHACSISHSAKVGGDKAIFVEFIKQTGWDQSSKTGTFKGGKQASIKFSMSEAADMIQAIEGNKAAFEQYSGKTGAYHSSEQGSAIINFEPYIDKGGKQRGFSLSVGKKVEGETLKFIIGLSFAEMTLVREYLKFALERCFTAIHSEEKKKREEFSKKKSSSKSSTKEKESTTEEEDLPF